MVGEEVDNILGLTEEGLRSQKEELSYWNREGVGKVSSRKAVLGLGGNGTDETGTKRKIYDSAPESEEPAAAQQAHPGRKIRTRQAENVYQNQQHRL